MLTMDQLAKMRVYVPRKPSRRDEKKGIERGPKKLGKIHYLVFSANSKRVVGFMVRRPDIAGMVKQDDRFLALDAIELREGGILCTRGNESFDAEACKRLGIDLDTCIIWSGCDVRCASGKFLGYVMDASFNEKTGDVDCFSAQEGSTASALVGSFEIPAAWVLGYKSGCMVVRDEAAYLELSGGLAGKAGEGYAAAKESAKQAAEKAGAAASVAVDKGSHGLGKALGRAKMSVQQTAGEFKEASGGGTSGGNGRGGASGGVGRGGASSGKKSSTNGNKVAKPSRDADNGQKAARAVGEQLNKTKGMFSGFMREFKDASK